MIRPGVRRLLHLRLRRREDIARDTAEEIAAHLAARAEQLERLGLSPEAARAEALRRFGPLAEAERRLVGAATRRERRLALRERLDGWAQDLRSAWRSTIAEPGVTAVVVAVIALAVAANAATFGILDRLLLQGPAHVRDAGAVTRVFATADYPAVGRVTGDAFGYATYTALRDGVDAFAGVAAVSYGGPQSRTLGSGADAEQVGGMDATWDLFPLLGVDAVVGRFFGPAEDRPGSAQPVAVLGHDLWQRRFAGDRAVLGRQVLLDGSAYTVVGVAPPAFTGAQLGRVDVWLPMSLRGPQVTDDWQTSLGVQWLQVVARLAPGATAEGAAAEATAANRALYAGSGEPLEEAELSPRPLWYGRDGSEATEVAVARWLLAVALVVLLVACANVGNLLLARAMRRRREIAMRLALGISRARMLRLLLLEGLLLAALGGAAAFAVVPAAAGLLRRTLLPDVEWAGTALDPRVLAVALALTLGTGVVTGLAPAVLARRGDLVQALRGGVRDGGTRSSRLRVALTVAQAASSVVLLVAAGLFARSLWRAERVDLGLEPRRVLAASARWPRPPQLDEMEQERRQRSEEEFFGAALATARRLPGVESAALAVGTPFSSSFTVPLRVPGRESLPELPGGGPYVQAVTAGYLQTLGLRLLAGRDFTDGDRAGSERVALVNRTMAEALWPAADVLGGCLQVGDGEELPCTRVVGVVEDAGRFGLGEPPAMQYYLPLGQEEGFGGTRLLVRPGGPAAAAAETLRGALRGLDPEVLWVHVTPLAAGLEPQLRPWRLGASVIGALGVLALVVAALGLSSLVTHLVASRTHELGVRRALGAQRRDVLGLVLRRGLGLTAAGVALGVLLAAVLAPRLAELLFETSPHDPLVYCTVSLGLLATAAAACLPPARRALRVDAASALREE